MTTSKPSIADKRSAFRKLHTSGCFIMPNPWDTGSACLLQKAGYKALATTSAGFAWSRGMADGHTTLDMTLTHLHEIVNACDVPINADFETGFASCVTQIAENVRLAIETGIAGLSLQDSTGDADRPLLTITEACQRIQAARRTIDHAGGEVLLTARAEGFWVGRPDLDDTQARLKAYADAGADCLFAPGIQSRAHIAAVVAAVHSKPVNLLVSSASELTMTDIAALGVRRVSVGGALARTAWGAFIQAAGLLLEHGSFAGFATAISGSQLDELFAGAATDRSVHHNMIMKDVNHVVQQGE